MLRRLMLTLLVMGVQAQVVEELTVILREVRVHVTGEDGQPIRGLNAEDFVLEENGTPKKIDFFKEVDLTDHMLPGDDAAAPSDATGPDPGVTVLLLDTSNLARRDFPKLKEAAQKIIDSFGRPTDLMKIVQFEDSLIHLTPFTADRTALRAALERANYQGLMRSRLEFQEKEMVRIYEEVMRADRVTRPLVLTDLELALDEKDQLKLDHQRNFQRNMAAFVYLLRSMPGDKTIFFLTGGNYISQDGGLYSTKGENSELIRNLNAANISLYTLFFGSKDPVGFAFRNATLPATAVGSVTLPGGRREIFENVFQLESGPADLSNETGGFFERVLGTQDEDVAVTELMEETSHYYRIGYSIDAPSKSKVKISLAKTLPQKVTLRYGERFVPPKTYAEMDEPQQILTFEALLFYSQAFRDDLNVTARADLFLAPDKSLTVPVTLRFPLESIPESGFEVGLSLLSAEREVVDVTKSLVLNPPKNDWLCLADVLLPRRIPKYFRYSIRDLDRDLVSIGEITLDPPPHPKSGLHLGPALLGAVDRMGFVPLHHVRLAGKDDPTFKEVNQPRVTNDPFHMGSYLFTPQIEPVFSSPLHLEVFFHVLGVDGALTHLASKFFAVNGDEVTELPGKLIDIASPSKDRMHCVARCDTGMLAPGHFRLLIQITEQVSAVAMSTEIPFEVKP